MYTEHNVRIVGNSRVHTLFYAMKKELFIRVVVRMLYMDKINLYIPLCKSYMCLCHVKLNTNLHC